MKMCNSCRTKKDEVTIEAINKAHINGFRPTFIYPGGGSYRGSWRKSLHHGYGIKITKNNLVYDGQWRYGQRHGYGTLRCLKKGGLSERIYIGQWCNDMINGEGKMFYPNGTYFGWWKCNKRSGIGIMWYHDESIYLGEWEKNVYHGTGVLFCGNLQIDN